MVYRHLYVVITLQVGHFVRWARGARRASSGEKVSLRFLHRAGVRHPSRQVVAPSVIPADAGIQSDNVPPPPAYDMPGQAPAALCFDSGIDDCCVWTAAYDDGV